MPSHVRIFWWLSVAIVAYWILSDVWRLSFPSARYLAVVAKLDPRLREGVHRADLQIAIMGTAIWGGATLGTAWLAAFRRRNWARWAFAFVFLLREAMPFLIAAYFNTVMSHLMGIAHWTDPWAYLVPALSITAIAFVFSGNAREWFRRPQDATSA